MWQIEPYSGIEPFIFISYSHRDREIVAPFASRLQSDRYRIWFDDGIEAGSEWARNIAEHLRLSSCVICFLSKNYLQSENCLDEIEHAKNLGKPTLIIYTEDVVVPEWFSMRHGRTQAIFCSNYKNEEALYKRIYEAKILTESRDMSDSAEYEEYLLDTVNKDLRLICVIDSSGSMNGEGIHEINCGMEQLKDSLLKKYGSRLQVDILQYDTQARWKTLSDLPMEAGGSTNVGEALDKLKEYGKCISNNCMCAIMFTNDGLSSDSYDYYLRELKQEEWFQMAAKMGIAIGADADIRMLERVTESGHVDVVNDVHLLAKRVMKNAELLVCAIFHLIEHASYTEGRYPIDSLKSMQLGLQLFNEIETRKRDGNWSWEKNIPGPLTAADVNIIAQVAGCWCDGMNAGEGEWIRFYTNQNHERHAEAF